MRIHPTAIIDEQASIGEGVMIGPFCVIEGPARIGAGTRLYQSVYLSGDLEIGENCELHPFCVIGHMPQDFSYDTNTRSGVRIGNNCVFREGVTIHRGTEPGSATILEDGIYMMAYSHVAHNCRVEKGVTMANGALLAGYVSVGERAFISGNAAVHQHVAVGRYAMVSALSFLTKDIPPFCTVQRVPASVAGMNTVGLRRGGFDQDERNQIKQVFRTLYRSGLSVSSAVAKLRDMDMPFAREYIEFIEQSKRGLARFKRDNE